MNIRQYTDTRCLPPHPLSPPYHLVWGLLVPENPRMKIGLNLHVRSLDLPGIWTFTLKDGIVRKPLIKT